MSEDDLHLWRIRRGGQEVFFNIKRGAKSFFRAKKGGRKLFLGEKKGAKSFFGKKKGGLRVFYWSKIPKTRPRHPANFGRSLRYCF